VRPLRIPNFACLYVACLRVARRQAPVCRRAATGRRRQGFRIWPTAIFVVALLLGVLVTPLAVGAQQAGKVPRIGFLSPSSASAVLSRHEAFRQGLSELGYIEGKNIDIEYRFAEGKFDRLTDLAAELVRVKVDVIVAVVTQASLAAKKATQTIPIVMVAVADPMGSGLIASLAHPGGNITGTSGMTAEVIGKSLELLKEAVPKVSRVAVLSNPGNPVFQAQLLRQTEVAARTLGVQLQILKAGGPTEFGGAFAAMSRERAGALLVFPDPMFTIHAGRIIDFATKSRLPAMYWLREQAEAGGLLSYGTNYAESSRRAATYVDKILKGAKPADLPVEQPTKFELIVNLKTAKALGLTIPQSVLIRADEVIQ
jgi:putative ABC transport system substrate-binding protein